MTYYFITTFSNLLKMMKNFLSNYNLWYSLQVFYNTYNVTAYQKHLWSSFTGFIVAFLVVAFLIVICCYSFYPIRRICIQSSTIYTYSMTFVIHFNGAFKNRITSFHWCFHTHLFFCIFRIYIKFLMFFNKKWAS